MHKAIRHFRKNDPVMFRLAKKANVTLETYGPRDYFSALCYGIMGQQLSMKAAASIYARFVKLCGGKVAPAKIAKFSEKKLRAVGTSWAKARSLRDLAIKVSSKQLNLKKLDKLSDAEVVEELIQVKGIGPWTAEMFLMFTLGREDVFSPGDLGLRKAIMKHYSIRILTKEKMEKLAERWSPHRTYASRVLWKTIDG